MMTKEELGLPELNGPITIDPLDPEVEFILGRPGFQTGPMCGTLRQLGYVIKCRYEDEQAAGIIWLLRMYQKHGEKWREQAEATLSMARAAAPV
jgi:hypothetical protein